MNAVVEDVRAMWSHAGVEIESSSGNKIRCRMPPYFQGVQEFTQSLEHHDVVVDLETSQSNGTASVVFLVYGADTRDRMAEREQGRGVDITYILMVALCIIIVTHVSSRLSVS